MIKGIIDSYELWQSRPENLNENMEDPIESAENRGWNQCNRSWIKTIEEQPRVGEWKRTAEEKPDYTRHVIITYGSSRHASKYGYYFKKEDKWYRDHRCIEEIEPPYAWTEMPEVPEEFVCGMCCG